jgi:3-isopropylmalate/(R)-2-methylmalate dehydratase small subunit
MRIEDKVISRIVGRAIPKPAAKQNTDDILPAQYLKEITFANMGKYVYDGERFKNGIPVAEHPFNDPQYAGRNILLAGADYGCGSSREHAPQGLYRFGIRAIVAESFHEIFAGNCASIGLVAVTAKKEDVEELVYEVNRAPLLDFQIDLNRKKLSYLAMAVGYGPNKCASSVELDIDLPEGRRQAFLNGTWDALSVLGTNEEGIKKAEESLEYLKFKFQ